mmetsp:Transcript_11178/g.16658  ORF Transcript_11178/g.16658 Transcript_11178/m.16658 type:complete len:127 (-) Transcript_11178:262-642(-)
MPKDRKRAPRVDVVTREFTINLHKRLHGVGAKRRAPRAVAEIKKFAQKVMGTTDVRVDTGLNKFVWSKGIRNVPFRVRVRLARKVAEDEEASEKLYTLCTYEPKKSFKGLENITVEDEEVEAGAEA